MKQCLQFISILLIILLSLSCSHKISEKAVSLPPIVKLDSLSQKYNIQIDFMKHHFSGLLIVRKMDDHEIRILSSSYFGMSLFDFSFQNDKFIINSCLEPLRKKKILNLLEMDFKNVFLTGKNSKRKEKSAIFEKRTSGKGFGKSVFYSSDFSGEAPNRIKIRHPWMRLTIQLDKLNENNP